MDVELAQQYVVSGIEATKLHLVRSVDECHTFAPDMCHQVFGENETIFGYKNLKIHIFYDAATFKCYANYKYDEILQDSDTNLTPENIMSKLDNWLPTNHFQDKEEFFTYVNKEKKPKPFGKLMHSFTVDTEKKKNRQFGIYLCNNKDPRYQDFHQRMETIIVWFIDAANYIDIEDEKWQFFVLYEKTENGDSFPVGYSTVYEYFAYPESRRYRISQFIILPPYQNFGLGKHLLQTIYRHLTSLDNIYDITVEDPSEKFQSLRDYLDAKSCLTLPVFNPPLIKADFSKDMINEARSKFKITEKQCRRIYEILRLHFINVDDTNEYNSYKIMVKSRLNVPFKKQQQHNKKYRKYFKEMPQLQADHNIKMIEKEFQQLMKQYRHVIHRIQKQ